MSKKRRMVRIPLTGEPVMILVETKDGWMLKAPALTNRDHLMLLKATDGVSKHLTDEMDPSPSRHVHVGKITKDTPRPAMKFYEDHAVNLDDGEEIFTFDLSALLEGGGLGTSSSPSADLPVTAASFDTFRTVDLSTTPVFRRTSIGVAKKAGFFGGFRRIDAENVAVLRLSSGQLIQLTLSEFFGQGAETARVMGVGELMGRAKTRRSAAKSE
jgi:hypothetical protein